MKILVGITGASGGNLGIKLANTLRNYVQTEVIFSPNSKITLKIEQRITVYDDDQIYASPASGSSKFDKMIITPCSINSLAKISCGICDTLITRAAGVMIKERKTLILGIREMPLSTISLRQMADLSALGVIISPPILAYYSQAKTIEELENFIIGKWLDSLGIEHDIFKRWEHIDQLT